jgi:purine-nucleoside phosphorylase
MEDFRQTVDGFRTALSARSVHKPRVGVILGSGLSSIADTVAGESIEYGEIPGLPRPTVEGHRGFLKINKDYALLAGRFHFYEGHDIRSVVKPVMLLKALGVQRLIVTNAAGGVNREYRPGQIVLIQDHINLMGANPLVGPNSAELGPRFPDMSDAYSRRLRKLIHECTDRSLKEGVYAGLSGPCYETPAEIRMLEHLGADMVGMSTVPEVIAANYLGIETVGFSCITNMAAGILDQPLNHGEVIETAARVETEFRGLVEKVMELLLAE